MDAKRLGVAEGSQGGWIKPNVSNSMEMTKLVFQLTEMDQNVRGDNRIGCQRFMTLKFVATGSMVQGPLFGLKEKGRLD
jgi:hypothetical protein